MSGNSNFPGSLNGKVNGVPAGLLPGTFPGQGLRNMTPGAAINALLMNKKNGNVGNSTVLTNGLSPASTPPGPPEDSTPPSSLVNGDSGIHMGTNGLNGSGGGGGSISSEDSANSGSGTAHGGGSSILSVPSPSTSSISSPSKVHENPDGSKSGPGFVQPPFRPAPGATLRYTTRLNYLKTVLVKAIWKQKHHWPFKAPVDAVKLNIPDYHDIIKSPMDLGTITKRLENFYYHDSQACINDFKQMFTNCYTYNKDTEDVWKMAQELEKVFLNKLAGMPAVEEDLPVRMKFGKGGVKGKRGPGRPAGSGNKKPLLAVSRVPKPAVTMPGPPVQHYTPAPQPHIHQAPPPVIPVHPTPVPPRSQQNPVYTGLPYSTNAQIRPPPPPKPHHAAAGAAPPQTATKPKKPPQVIVLPRNPPPAQPRGAPLASVPKGPLVKSQQPPVAPPRGMPPIPVVSTTPVKKSSSKHQSAGELLREQMVYCHTIIKEMFLPKYQPFAWPFYTPVDVAGMKLYDYHTVIKRPMDLGTVRGKLENGAYKSPTDFAEDVRLIFFNCYRYNPDSDEVVQLGYRLQVMFESKWAHLPGDLPITRSVARERQALMLCPLPEVEEPGREAVRSPVPRASTSKAEPGPNKRKETKAALLKADMQAEMQATINNLQEQIKEIKNGRKAEDEDQPKAKRQKKKDSTPVIDAAPKAGPSSILANLMDDKKLAAVPPAPKKRGRKSLDESSDADAAAGAGPAKKPRKPRTPKPKPDAAIPFAGISPTPQRVAQQPPAPVQRFSPVPQVVSPQMVMPQQHGAPVIGNAGPSLGLSPRRAPLASPAAIPAPAPVNLPIPGISPRQMTYEEKQQLSVLINDMQNERLERVVQIIQTMEPQYADAPEEIEIDFETLRPDTLCALEAYINEALGRPARVPVAAIPPAATPQLPPVPQVVAPPLPPVMPTPPVKPTEKTSPAKVKPNKKAGEFASSSESSSDDSESSDSESEGEDSTPKKPPVVGVTPLVPATAVDHPVFGAAPRLNASLIPPAGAGLMGVAAEAKTFGTLPQGLRPLAPPEVTTPPVTGLGKLATGPLKPWSTFGKNVASSQQQPVPVPAQFSESFEQFRKNVKEKEEKQRALKSAEAAKRLQRDNLQREAAKRDAARISEQNHEMELEKAHRAHFEPAGHHHGYSAGAAPFGYNHHQAASPLGGFTSPAASMSPGSTPMSPGDVASPPDAAAAPVLTATQLERNRQREAEKRKRQAITGRIDLNRQHDLMQNFEQQMNY